MKTNLTKTHDIDAAYKEFDFTDIAKKYQDAGTKYEIYTIAYEDSKQNGIQQEITKPIQAQGSGEILGEQSLGFRKNPAVATMKDAVDTLNKIGIQLGLTPKGRQELLEIVGEETNKASTAEMLKEFLGK